MNSYILCVFNVNIIKILFEYSTLLHYCNIMLLGFNFYFKCPSVASFWQRWHQSMAWAASRFCHINHSWRRNSNEGSGVGQRQRCMIRLDGRLMCLWQTQWLHNLQVKWLRNVRSDQIVEYSQCETRTLTRDTCRHFCHAKVVCSKNVCLLLLRLRIVFFVLQTWTPSLKLF